MQLPVILKLLTLLMLANGTPVIAKAVLRNLSSRPLDGGLKFIDGQPLFGPSKTIRGIVLSVLVTSVCAPLIGLQWKIGACVGSAAMAGDLFSSFVKRRLHQPSGGRVIGLDQIPESLFPLLACRNLLSLTALEITLAIVIFVIGAVLVPRLLFKFDLRDRPY